jgi:hypothetical protein
MWLAIVVDRLLLLIWRQSLDQPGPSNNWSDSLGLARTCPFASLAPHRPPYRGQTTKASCKARPDTNSPRRSAMIKSILKSINNDNNEKIFLVEKLL